MPVTLKGATELRKALKQFAPDLGKATTKEIGAILKPITNEARGFVTSNLSTKAPAPLSGWYKSEHNRGRYAFNIAEVKRGITYKTTPTKPNSNGFVSLASIWNKSAAGAVYETAGRKTIGGNFTPRLVPLTNSPAGKGRMIYKAWENNKGQATAAVVRAIEEAAKKLNARATA